jgi:hypothetical protein
MKKTIIIFFSIIIALIILFFFAPLQKLNDGQGDECSQKIRAIGKCETSFYGYEFDGNRCIKRGIIGCSIKSPFKTLEECREKCEK